MKVVILRCVKCDEPKVVKPGEVIPSFCFYCGGYLVYVEETEFVTKEADDVSPRSVQG